MSSFPLSEAQKNIINHRGCDLQIIACAGAGKTEAVSRRVAALLKEGIEPASIIAFTFTEKSGAELKERIYRRSEEILGKDFLDRLGPMYVGTIHGWCFRVLQDNVPRFGNYEVIDEHRHAALLSREAKTLDLKALAGKHWDGVRAWERIIDIASNELMGETELEASGYLDRYKSYCDLMSRFHFLTFSRIIAETVDALEDPVLGPRIRGHIRHLIVDEYQDINPAQERLISLIAVPPVELCVVGDDDQAIYQWRGSDVRNIITFADRHTDLRLVRLLENRRSRPEIILKASNFASTIPERLKKMMTPVRENSGRAVHLWLAATDVEEAEAIALTIERIHSTGSGYSEIAILLRSVRGAGAPIIEALRKHGIPFAAGGRAGLFMVPELAAIGELYAFLASFQWRDGAFGPSRETNLANVAGQLTARFPLHDTEEIIAFVKDWKNYYERLNSKPIDLIGDYYHFLDWLGVPETLDPDSSGDAALLGAIARFSTLLADYEHVTRRGRYTDEPGGRIFLPGHDRGKGYWFGLGNYLLHYAFDAYEDFEGEDNQGADVVQILTVHQAKGLEWPIVFMPSLVTGRFPSGKTGIDDGLLFPESVFPLEKRIRYAGTDGDERRLFYTAMTRARDMLYCSGFGKKTRKFNPSPYLLELANGNPLGNSLDLPLPICNQAPSKNAHDPIELSFSDIATWEDCGYRYRLGSSFGFQNILAEELGYGNAVHHVLRNLAEITMRGGEIPSVDEATALLEREFYAPFANPSSHEQMRAAAQKLVERYLKHYGDDLRRIWAVERPFELHTDDGLLSGRADVILDAEGGSIGSLAVVDYKVATREDLEARYQWQLRVYSHAAQREGWDVRGAYLHILREGERTIVSLDEAELAKAITKACTALSEIRAGSFPPRPSEKKCSACDYREICGKRAALTTDNRV